MNDVDLKRAMSSMLDGEPRGDVDLAGALDAGKAALRARRIKSGVAALLIVGIVGAAAPVGISLLGRGAAVHPDGPGPVSRPPTASAAHPVLATHLVWGTPVVRADAQRSRAFVIIPVRNDGAEPVGVAGAGHEPAANGAGLTGVDLTVADQAAASGVTTVPAAQIPQFLASLGDATNNVVIAPGGTALYVVAVTRDCSQLRAVPEGIIELVFAPPGNHALHIPPGTPTYVYRLIDAPAATPTWLTTAWGAACLPGN